jgi:hypothetical protein
VAEQLLDRPQVGTAFEQVGRERVAEAMWMWNQAAQRRGVEAPSTRGKEERILCATGKLGPRAVEIQRDEVRRLLAERDDPVLRTLALSHVHEFLFEVDVTEIEADRFRAAQTG